MGDAYFDAVCVCGHLRMMHIEWLHGPDLENRTTTLACVGCACEQFRAQNDVETSSTSTAGDLGSDRVDDVDAGDAGDSGKQAEVRPLPKPTNE